MRVQCARQIHYDSGPHMTPLVDIVMVILIFLMLAGHFGSMDHYLVSKTPLRVAGGSHLSAPSMPPHPDDPLLEIRVDPTGDGFLARVGNVTTADPQALTREIANSRLRMNNAGTDDDQIQVVIEPARDVRHKFVVQVYEAAMRAGYTKITFGKSH